MMRTVLRESESLIGKLGTETWKWDWDEVSP